tara:strand:+ start:12447 stop:12767 length:321 start_codon:yes stop_codon:yes gene_type:complete
VRVNVPWEEIERRRRERRVLLAGIVGLGVMYGAWALLGDTGVIRHYNKFKEHQDLGKDIGKINLWNEVLESEIDKAKNDPTRVEGLARTSLGMVREDEKVFRFVDP